MTITGPALLREIANAIDEHPENYDQNIWIEHPPVVPNGWESVQATEALRDLKVGDCGTKGCLAGWAVAINTPLPNEPWDPKNPVVRAIMNADQQWDRKISHFNNKVKPLAIRLIGFADIEDDDGNGDWTWSDAASTLFDGSWEPADGMTVGDALRAMADRTEQSGGGLTEEIVREFSSADFLRDHG